MAANSKCEEAIAKMVVQPHTVADRNQKMFFDRLAFQEVEYLRRVAKKLGKPLDIWLM